MSITFWIIFTVICGILSYYLNQSCKQDNRLQEREEYWKNQIEIERAQAVKQSKAVTRGNISQEFIPLFPDFPYNLSDCKFSGQPLDYIVFKGMSDFRDGLEAEISIIFADVKVGSAQRTKIQNGIKKAIEDGRVSFETWTIKDDKTIKVK